MNKTKHQTEAAKVREKRRLLHEEQRVLGKRFYLMRKPYPKKLHIKDKNLIMP
jgi:hypothetical protein